MNQALALDILGKIMNWDINRAREEDAWLRLLSRIKYDAYQDYLAGVRFIESLADWLQQFEPKERETAYEFIRNHLVYFSTAEIQHLIELVYHDTVQPHLLAAVAQELNVPYYLVWAQPHTSKAYNLLLRKTLFLGLSEGARIDSFRRANAGIISNEQVVLATQIDSDKWDDLLKDLRKDLEDESAKFLIIYLLDDFVASGKTLIRKDEEKWKGKLIRFRKSIQNIIDTHFEKYYIVRIHHYISSYKASIEVPRRYGLALRELGANHLFTNAEFTFSMVLPEDLPIDKERYGDFMKIIEKYYDPAIHTESLSVGGDDARLGFGACALPVILEHNTPNNSVALLWAESDGNDNYHSMRPLFRRRQRHL